MSDFRRNRVREEEESETRAQQQTMQAQNEASQATTPVADYIHDEYDDYSPWE